MSDNDLHLENIVMDLAFLQDCAGIHMVHGRSHGPHIHINRYTCHGGFNGNSCLLARASFVPNNSVTYTKKTNIWSRQMFQNNVVRETIIIRL